jgi:hypothetical protein
MPVRSVRARYAFARLDRTANRLFRLPEGLVSGTLTPYGDIGGVTPRFKG